jgi:hypothetical protein
MQSKESLSPSTVFDLPPQETETLTAQEFDDPASTLPGNMDTPSTPPAGKVSSSPEQSRGKSRQAPEVQAFEGPAFEDVPYADETASEGISPWSEGALDWTESNSAVPNKPAKPTPEETRLASVKDDQDKVAQLGLPLRDNAAALATARQANFRRPHTGRIIALTLLLNLLALAGAGYWYHQRFIANLNNRLDSRGVPAPSPVPANAGSVDAADTAKLTSELAGLAKTIADLQQQGEAQKGRLEEMGRVLVDAKTILSAKTAAESKQPPPAASSLGTDLPPSQSELVLLKERNRLTAYADEAIATGARAPYQRLWEALDDPRLADLVHAARAEILRVQNFYLGGSRLERFEIPVATYFPEDAALKDTQLKDGQLIKLLHGQKNPWEVRVKAAFILGTRRSMEVGDALIETVKRDENLDVVKEATFSFEQLTGYRSRIFDATSMEEWWKQYRATPTPVPAPAKTTVPAPAPAPDTKGGDGKSGDAKAGDVKTSAPKSESKGSEPKPATPKTGSKGNAKSGQAKKS